MCNDATSSFPRVGPGVVAALLAVAAGSCGGGAPIARAPSAISADPMLRQLLLSAGEANQRIQFNPDAALQKQIFADGFSPNSGEFYLGCGAATCVGQRAEHLGSGEVRVYYAVVGDWGNVRHVTRGAETSAIERALVQAGEAHQVIQFNPGAALQKRIFGDGFIPNSGEFQLGYAGRTYVCQRAEDLRFGQVRVYFALYGAWSDVGYVSRNPATDRVAIGLTGRELMVAAGADFQPASCPQCLRVQGGHLVNPDGSVFLALGANLPVFRDGDMSGMSWTELKLRHVQVIRLFASGGNLDDSSGDTSAWVDRVARRVDEAWANGFRVIVSFADYYHPLPGEQLVPDNYYSPTFNFCGLDGVHPQINVRPWPWYRRGVPRFDFRSACPNAPTLSGAPNYEVVYKPFALALVRRLAGHPGVMAFALGNELRALGRGGAGTSAIPQLQAVQLFADFMRDMITSIRAIDRNHLIIPGVQNVTEVADQPSGGSTWNETFDVMLTIPFDAWTLTFYNDNPDAERDVIEFHRYAVPVLALELDWWCPPGQPSSAGLIAETCESMNQGLSLAAPWARSEMSSVCGTGAIDSAWQTWGYIGGTLLPSGSCGSLDPTPLPIGN